MEQDTTSTTAPTKPNDSAAATPPIDNAEVLRRVSLYLEEDDAIAHTLAKCLTPESARALSAALDSTEYTVHEPRALALRRVALRSGVPFVAFGIMDNAIMIIAGEYIDLTLGVTLGISTMAAAALGNLVSDLAGVGLGGVVEGWAAKIGLPDPGLSRAQMNLRSVRTAGHIGCAIGVTIGCLLGMFPLLLLPSPEALEEKKRIEKTVALVDVVMHEATDFLDCEGVTLFIADHDQQKLWSQLRGYDSIRDLTLSFDEGPVGRVAREGKPLNLPADAATKSVLCMPVTDSRHKVRAVVQAVGKRGDKTPPPSTAADDTDVLSAASAAASFTAADEAALAALCSHISADLEALERTGAAQADLRQTLSLLRSHGDLSPLDFPPARRSSVRPVAPPPPPV
ncbi:hypothetical protein JKP88DRAFT_317526 [Tribonema minus]|uniref:GAF domain-containing protein n=1 Tax=Tribonema minus TaxID=303371 RepID=A0A835YYR0_9STRA|nr:hypothetical protein JKP88DRAFT_317526 [Tribonema minus]